MMAEVMSTGSRLLGLGLLTNGVASGKLTCLSFLLCITQYLFLKGVNMCT